MPRLAIRPAAQWGALALAIGLAAPPVHALTPNPTDAATILRSIQRLSVVGRVLYVAAHPDDENTRLLSWLVDHEKVETAYLSLTRGEGGQNLLGPEQAPLLGVIRTEELLDARGIDGAEQLFGLDRDFGFSKTPEETLGIWGKDAALGDVVWAIRKFQPDVIITRFSPEDRHTHGHHTASAILALEAFHAAADPKAFPEQLQWVRPWQARRIVWNKGIFGGATPPGPLDGFVSLDIGGWDPLLGRTAGEVAARSRSMHKSQGFGTSPERGPIIEYFKVLAGDPMRRSFLDDVDLTWGRVAGSAGLRADLDRIRGQFDVQDPARSIPALLDAAQALRALPDNPWKAEKQADLDAVIAACAGLHIDATAATPSAVPGAPVKVTLTALNRSDVPWSLHAVRLEGVEGLVNKALKNNQPLSVDRTVTLPVDTTFSNPYWLVDDPEPGRWTVRDQTLVGRPEQPPPLVAEFDFTAAGRPITLIRPVTYVWNDPVAGEQRRPLEILPPATVHASAPLLIFPDARAKELLVTVRSSRGALTGTVAPDVPEGFEISPESRHFTLAGTGAEQTLSFKVTPVATLSGAGDSVTGVMAISGKLDGSGAPIDRSVIRIEYPHIPIQTLTPRAEVKLVRLTLKRGVTRVGYVPGAGDDVPAALRQAGYEVTMLNDEALATESLRQFQAIVVGVRAFNTNPRLHLWHRRLMEFVEGGGILLVQYNTQNHISRIVGDIGPWPFHVSQDRVTQESAPVDLLVPEHPVFSRPNAISPSDFEGWVQERGLYFADKWDEHYTPLLSMHDAGEPPREGSLLVAHDGKGIFIYTGLAFFRQLPVGVPGAYRLFANLLSHER